MKYYQLTYLISPDLSEEELKELSQKVNSLIQGEGGILAESENLVKERLGYPIKKVGAACLVTLNFHLNPEKLEDIERKLRAEQKILRYMILAKKALKKIPKIEIKPPEKILKPKKVELKEIEKKLEEILGE